MRAAVARAAMWAAAVSFDILRVVALKGRIGRMGRRTSKFDRVPLLTVRPHPVQGPPTRWREEGVRGADVVLEKKSSLMRGFQEGVECGNYGERVAELVAKARQRVRACRHHTTAVPTLKARRGSGAAQPSVAIVAAELGLEPPMRAIRTPALKRGQSRPSPPVTARCALKVCDAVRWQAQVGLKESAHVREALRLGAAKGEHPDVVESILQCLAGTVPPPL